MSEKPSFFSELKRRNVYKVAVAYAVVAWLLIQVATQIFPFFDIPNWAVRLVVILLILGFPVALLLAWAFELTPEGIKRTDETEPAKSKGHAWIYIAIVAAALSVGLFFLGRFTAPKRGVTTDIASKSIAVLPFESLSEDKSNSYFADGIQDEILARLSKIADLRVISRTSTQKYKSTPANLREIAQQLGVTNILEGSVQKAGDQVRITVQLINAVKDDHLWADTYDRSMTDIFGVESDVAQKIATSLEAKLTGREQKEIASVETKNPEAYEAFLRAIALRGGQQETDQEKRLQFLRHAVELDSNYAQAWAALAMEEAEYYFYPEHSEAQKERARTAAETAIRVAPDLPLAHAAMGVFKYHCLQDFDGALVDLNTAYQHAPNDARIVAYIGYVYRRQGNVEDCINTLKGAVKLDPLNPDLWINLGRTYRGMRKFDDARAMFDHALNIVPNDTAILVGRAETYLAQGDVDTAWKSVNQLNVNPDQPTFAFYMQLLLMRRQFDEMLKQVSSIIMNKQSYPPLLQKIAVAGIAILYLQKGERDRALPYVEQMRGDRHDLQKMGGVRQPLADFYIEVEARMGNRQEVEREIQDLFEQTRKDKWVFPDAEVAAAAGYALLADIDRALPLLQDGLSKPSEAGLTTAYLRLNPIWDGVRNDPRFQKLANASP